MMIILGSLESM